MSGVDEAAVECGKCGCPRSIHDHDECSGCTCDWGFYADEGGMACECHPWLTPATPTDHQSQPAGGGSEET